MAARVGLPANGPLLVAAAAVALTALWPWQVAWPWATAALIALGVPHGALDGEIARPLLRPTCGRLWFLAFALPYLALFAAVMLAWRWAPMVTLAAFLGASVWHFGSEERGSEERGSEERGSEERESEERGTNRHAGDGVLAVLARGGLPIAVPVLVHPGATARVLAAIAQQPVPGIPLWLQTVAWLWVVLFAVWALRAATRGRAVALRLPAALVGVFVLLPPLQAFVVYFVCVHAPLHVAAIVGSGQRAPRVHDARSAWLLALPITALTVAIGASLWPLYAGPTAVRLLAVTLQTLAALTLPHMLLGAFTTRRSACRSSPPT